ncbi:hypothetical protein GCM10012275_47080 [Longimycelium tulufanense]|uniref:Uncharacterized protein n=1 Tax=Longimycelium tulufanense TaxID=907463 RepID=A0A8J3FYD8_9PSEU|nr:hypothetical protein [Longimycelium tulufanense]GGM71194.1 hypothetical protein GCM10012275_47080 [Longimycelium tulufanense]
MAATTIAMATARTGAATPAPTVRAEPNRVLAALRTAGRFAGHFAVALVTVFVVGDSEL